jgi:hypothetical protein
MSARPVDKCLSKSIPNPPEKLADSLVIGETNDELWITNAMYFKRMTELGLRPEALTDARETCGLILADTHDGQVALIESKSVDVASANPFLQWHNSVNPLCAKVNEGQISGVFDRLMSNHMRIEDLGV